MKKNPRKFVRLNDGVLLQLDRHAVRKELAPSEVMEQALHQYFCLTNIQASPYDELMIIRDDLNLTIADVNYSAAMLRHDNPLFARDFDVLDKAATELSAQSEKLKALLVSLREPGHE